MLAAIERSNMGVPFSGNMGVGPTAIVFLLVEWKFVYLDYHVLA
jgi:hypothetical protein